MDSGPPIRLRDAISALREKRITVTDKGFGRLASSSPLTAASLGRSRPSLFGGDFLLPLMVLRESALASNIESMAGYCAAAGVLLAPHGKTTMAPQLMGRQLEAGAWAVTAANVAQVQSFRSFGIPRILIGNEVTERAAIAWLAGELAADPEFECYCFVDSLAGVALLDDALRAGRPAAGAADGDPRLRVLVELGRPGGRAGCRSVDEAAAVARAAAAAPALCLAGAAGYDGGVGHDDSDATLAAVAGFCRDLRRLGDRIATLPGGQDGYLLSAGGSGYFDVVVRELTAPGAGGPVPTVVLRSGAYISYDHGYYGRIAPGTRPDRPGPRLVPAFELWAAVLSRPEPGLAIVGAGRHHVAFDQDMPVPLWTRPGGAARADPAPAAGMRVSAVDDQHAYLRLPADSALAPGDLVGMGISHPCTTFDKWRVIAVVDDDHHVIDAIHTFF
jgi:D-serine deaminase-like pyridoxal phosphate-dependent protein